jgi:type IV pilus assembly protein PilX
MNAFLRLRTRADRGSSLIVSLIFLVVMAMLSVTLANVTTLEERMAGSTRDRNLALQAAEAALRDAELRIATSPGFRATAFPAFTPLLANDATYWEACFASGGAPCDTIYQPTQLLPTLGPGAVAAQPRFIVERKPDIGPPGSITEIYRVTARAVGGSADTIVVLQAEFGFTP